MTIQTEAKFWTQELVDQAQAILPPEFGQLLLKSGVPSELSPRDVYAALNRFVTGDYGEGHPEGYAQENDGESRLMATYRTTDFDAGRPFYLVFTPTGWYKKLNEDAAARGHVNPLGPIPEFPPTVDVLTENDY